MNISRYLRENRVWSFDIGVAPRITCADGFILSVQASKFHYCEPRANVNVYTLVEVGFPSAEEPTLMEYAEEPDKPTQTVYGYVPVEVVEQIIENHGGVK